MIEREFNSTPAAAYETALIVVVNIYVCCGYLAAELDVFAARIVIYRTRVGRRDDSPRNVRNVGSCVGFHSLAALDSAVKVWKLFLK